MAKTYPIAYNPLGVSVGTNTIMGDFVIGTEQIDYSTNPYGLTWYQTPDEDLGYLIVGNLRNGINFWRSDGLSDQAFVDLANSIPERDNAIPLEEVDSVVSWLGTINYARTPQITTNRILAAGAYTKNSYAAATYFAALLPNGDVDNSFVLGIGFNNIIRTVVIDSNDRVLVAGHFTTYKGVGASRMIRLNIDGSIDTSFVYGTGFNGNVLAITIDSSGKILVGGGFTTYNGTSANYIIRLNSDGSIDTSFVYDTGFNGAITKINIDSNGKILVGGEFTTYKGNSVNRIIRLNSDGSIDPSFVYGAGFDGSIVSVVIDSNSKILVGGYFTTYNGNSANRIIRLNSDGSIDTSFVYGAGFDNSVWSIIVDSNSKILIGGGFTTYDGTTGANRIIRLNSDGSIDTSFVYDTGFNGTITNINIDSNGKILVGGGFTQYKGNDAAYFVMLADNGDVEAFTNTPLLFDNIVYTVAIHSSNKLFIGGAFLYYKQTYNSALIRLGDGGTNDLSFNNNNGGTPAYAVVVDSNNKILLGGGFTTYDGTGANRIIRLNSDETIDTSFVYGTGFNTTVYTLVIDSNGKIVVGGNFTTYQGTGANYIIKLNSDGSIDTSFVYDTGFNGPIRSMIIDSNGKILIAGNFTTYKGNSANRLIRLNSDGSVDTSFVYGTGFNNIVYSVAIDSNGKILVCGNFTTYQGTTANRIIRLNTDGSIDTSFVYGTGFNTVAYCVAVDSNGKILVGGQFATYQGTGASKIIRLNTDGSIDTSFIYGTGFGFVYVYTIILESNGKILIGGSFGSYQGISIANIVRLNADGSIAPFRSYFNSTVYSIVKQIITI